MSHATVTAPPLLVLNQVQVTYQGIIQAVQGVSFQVPERGFTALIGANGAGKTTTLKAISRLLGASRGALSGGTVHYQQRDISRTEPHVLVQQGLVQVLEGRRCFAHLTVEENLISGTLQRRLGRGALAAELERIYALFPRLRVRRHHPAGLTSGGEQQMLALARALLLQPRLLLLDEPSMGLAPQVVAEIFALLSTLNQQGLSLLVAEQNAQVALAHARDAVVLDNGQVSWQGSTAQLRDSGQLYEAYFGLRHSA